VPAECLVIVWGHAHLGKVETELEPAPALGLLERIRIIDGGSRSAQGVVTEVRVGDWQVLASAPHGHGVPLSIVPDLDFCVRLNAGQRIRIAHTADIEAYFIAVLRTSQDQDQQPKQRPELVR